MAEDPRRRAYGPYFRALADLMGLRDWTFVLADGPPDDPNHGAAIVCVYGRRLGNVAISDAFLDADPAGRRITAVHELLHAHFAAMNQLLHDEHREGAIPDSLHRAYVLAMESGIDAVAEALAPHLPLPDQVRPRRVRAVKEAPAPEAKAPPKPADAAARRSAAAKKGHATRRFRQMLKDKGKL
jgi:hypothetical protein